MAYKDQSNGGKVSAKKVMSFANKDVFETMANAKPTEYYDVTMEKGEKYWEWIKVTKGSATQPVVARTPGATSVSSTNSRGFETPEERAKKQVYIVRQSSLNVATAVLTVGAKTTPKSEDIIKLAKEFEAYVFESTDAQAVARKDVGGIEDLSEDPIPF